MSEKKEFNFGNDKVAQAYDKHLVPTLFIPWAKKLIEENQPWENKKVLDLASGTGVIPSLLAPHIQPSGRITALDINPQMLEVSKQRCAEWLDSIDYITSSAENTGLEDESIDVVLCQQGFQFFPERQKTALELKRVLRDNGKVIASTWCPVSECRFFEIVCEALEDLGDAELSQTMRIPFDFMSPEDLTGPFHSAGFSEAKVDKQELDLFIEDGIEGAIRMTYATPIAPQLTEFSSEKEENFKNLLREKLSALSPDNRYMGPMVTNVLTAVK